MTDIEIVTVFHREKNRQQAIDLRDTISQFEPDLVVHLVDNMRKNRGFAKGCNLGATWCSAPIVGFLNPDVVIKDRFAGRVRAAMENPEVVICGNRYGKPDRELKLWGVKHFVCGACFFVDRLWFEEVGRFDEQFVWSHEELDLIRQAEEQGKKVKELSLPIHHDSPTDDTDADARYKRFHFNLGARLYREKWGRS